MEKIKDYDIEKPDKFPIQGEKLMKKLEEIIVYFNWHTNRLKTLEDKVKFIMKHSCFVADVRIDDKTLQDLYDEENEPKISDIGEIEKHSTCKHTPIYSDKCCEECKPTVKECEHDWVDMGANYECFLCDKKKDKPTDNSEKIEEIISALKDRFVISDGVLCEVIDNELMNNTDMLDMESWLRDKLKNL